MRSEFSRRLRNRCFAAAAVLTVVAVACYFAFPSRGVDTRLWKWSKGTRLEPLARRQLLVRHFGPLAGDIGTGRFGYGTSEAELLAAYKPANRVRHGRFTTSYFRPEYVDLTSVDGQLIYAEAQGIVLFEPPDPSVLADRTMTLSMLRTQEIAWLTSRRALGGLVGFGAVADPRPQPGK